ncbi:MAG: sigma-70 family RNA polymerase sigma factor [Ruminiclostridium sp.]|nr:sigma-70 family RNA polymerase sigma factor [Ruminiclostridium sp.]
MTAAAIDWETVYKEYEPKVRAYIQSRVNDPEDRKDLCADVFLKLMQKRDELCRMPGVISSRIYLITKSRVIDYYRTRRISCEIPEDTADDTDIEAEVMSAETLGHLADALGQLDERLRDIITLHYYGGKTLVEIAKTMGMSYPNIKVLHKKALGQLKKLMER